MVSAHAHSGANYLDVPYEGTGGWLRSWFLTLDHKRIGILYMIGTMFMFFLAGLFAVLLRTELLTAGPTLPMVDGDMYNRFFTLHGGIMVFIVIIPGIPAAMGNFFLPIMIGAKDVAFPRLNLMSWYFWLAGTLLLIASLFFGGVDTGWTFYAPYSTEYAMQGVVPVLTGAFILGFSSIFTGLNFIVTVHKLRRPEMGWFQMPLFIWAIYSTAVIQVLATPVLAITLLMLLVDRTLGGAFFSPQFGGDPVLMQHFFWFYSHPAVYIMILPAMGVMSELISVHSHKHIFGYRFIAFSSVALAIFGFLVWGHHLFVSGQSQLVSMVFSALTFSVAIPSAVKMFNWLATMYKGSIAFTAGMLHAMSFMWIFAIGGLTGLFLGTLAVDVHLTDTYFVIAHFHYVMAGTIFVIFGAFHHWWPKITGRMYNEFWGQVAAVITWLGFNLVFFIQFLLGTRGMPRRYYDYTKLMPQHPEFQWMHQLSTAGSYVMAVGLIIMLVNLLSSLKKGRIAPANPWGGSSLEWHTTSPPPVENFHGVPHAGDPYDYEDLQYDPAIGGYVSRKRTGGAPVPAPAH